MTARRTDELTLDQYVQVGVIYRPIRGISRNGDRTYTVTLGDPVVTSMETPTGAVQASRLWITTPPATYGPVDLAVDLPAQPLR